VAIHHDLYVIADEVYEKMIFNGHQPSPLASYPGWGSAR
jgi:aspartate/methionine/tyrosine aminotransferase